ncbi:heterocyst frequency control protein PatD [Phormidesmis sp. 146-33]
MSSAEIRSMNPDRTPKKRPKLHAKLSKVSNLESMLPALHRDRYQEFSHALQALEALVNQPECDGAILKSEVLDIQKFFQTQISSLDLEALDVDVSQRSYAVQVEMDKQLRLLNMDVMFLQTARRSTTHDQRVQQIKERLKTLISYCQGLLTMRRAEE